MGKHLDISGQTFGRLRVIELNSRNDRYFYWDCECSCGSLCVVEGHQLRSGHTQSCGCLQKERASLTKRKILLGKTFGIVKVISFYGISSNQKAIWTCVCECGNIFNTLSGNLLTGDTKSCGCLKDSLVAHELKRELSKKYTILTEYKILKNSKTGYYLRFDIYIPEIKVFIEVNGRQHYEMIDFFHKDELVFEYNRKLDKIKKRYANLNGIYVEIDLRKIKTVDEALKYTEEIIDEKILL